MILELAGKEKDAGMRLEAAHKLGRFDAAVADDYGALAVTQQGCGGGDGRLRHIRQTAAASRGVGRPARK